MIDDLNARKAAAEEHARATAQEIRALEAEYNAAEVNGEDSSAIKKRLGKLNTEQAEAIRAAEAFRAHDKRPIISGKIAKLADEVIDERREAIKELQAEWNSKAAEAEQIKADFLQAVQALGIIERRSESLVSEAKRSAPYSSDPKQNKFIFGITTGISENRREGVIFIKDAESWTQYAPGRR